MSILQIVETSPSRVRGLVRCLVGLGAQAQKEAALKSMMSPETLPVRRAIAPDDSESDVESAADRRASGSQMIDKVIVGCERMGLVVREGEEIALNPALPQDARSEGKADARLPHTIAELVFSFDRAENHDLARLIAWYLLQDPLDPPMNEQSVVAALQRNAGLHEYFSLKNQSYGQFEDWVVYLGFSWASSSADRKRSITPDPTAFLRETLFSTFERAAATALDASEFVRLTAESCPVLEGGRFRAEVLELGGLQAEPSDRLSIATSQAWLRLEEEGYWELIPRSDAGTPVVLIDGADSRQIAAMRLKEIKTPRLRRQP
jgi:hypothetical protein